MNTKTHKQITAVLYWVFSAVELDIPFSESTLIQDALERKHTQKSPSKKGPCSSGDWSFAMSAILQ